MSIFEDARDAQGERKNYFLHIAVMAFFAGVAFYVAARYALVISRGGQYWTTGDWLINYDAGFVRRGLTGAVTLGLHDLTGIDVVEMAGITQIATYLLMVGFFLYNFSSVRWSGPVLMLLFSPVLLLMPFYYTKLSMLKEMIGFLALGMMAATAPTGRPVFLWLGIATLALAGFAHEINAFLAPGALVFVFLFQRAGLIGLRHAALAAAAVIFTSAAAILLSAAYGGHGLSEQICQALRGHGNVRRFCQAEGPIWWLERDTAYGIRFTWREQVESGVWPWFIAGYALAIAPFFLFRLRDDLTGRRTRMALSGVVLGILVMAPLFVVASDWGRWIALHVFVLALLTVTAIRLGFVEPRTVSLGPLFLVYGLGWSMADYGQPLSAGMLSKIEDAMPRIERALNLASVTDHVRPALPNAAHGSGRAP